MRKKKKNYNHKSFNPSKCFPSGQNFSYIVSKWEIPDPGNLLPLNRSSHRGLSIHACKTVCRSYLCSVPGVRPFLRCLVRPFTYRDWSPSTRLSPSSVFKGSFWLRLQGCVVPVSSRSSTTQEYVLGLQVPPTYSNTLLRDNISRFVRHNASEVMLRCPPDYSFPFRDLGLRGIPWVRIPWDLRGGELLLSTQWKFRSLDGRSWSSRFTDRTTLHLDWNHPST